MQINFNALRKQVTTSYNSLIKKLNMSLCEDKDCTRVVIPVEDLQRDLDSIRKDLLLLNAAYVDGDKDCEPLDMNILNFNPENLQ